MAIKLMAYMDDINKVNDKIGSTNGGTSPSDSEKAFEVVELAIRSSKSLQQQLSDMMKLCRSSVNGDEAGVDNSKKFEELKSECAQTLSRYNTSLNSKTVQQNRSSMALQLPDFNELTGPIFTSHSPDNQPTVGELSGYVSNRKSLRHTDKATIQGIRIFSRYPDDSSRAPHKAINSLASLTGTSVSILGNAVSARSPAKNLKVPLSFGELAINTVEIATSDGTAESLVAAINASSTDHHTQASLGDDGHLMLFRLDGEAIRIAVRSQSAAFVSGFRMGVKVGRSGSFGVPIWVQSSQGLPASHSTDSANKEAAGQTVRFDSDETGLALTGKAISELQLTAFDWRNISCADTNNARFALILVKYMMRQVCAQALRLLQQIKYLCAREKSIVKNFSDSSESYKNNSVEIQKRMRDMQDRLSAVALQADSYA